jgi:CelD/BcsL family acetyltransferase involved in cellulose biosynthesis
MMSTAVRAPARDLDARSRLSVEMVTDNAGFDRLREQWNALADRMVPSSPMLSWEWLRLWWSHFRGANRLQIVTFVRDGTVVGIAPFQERRIGVGPLAIRMLKPIGWEDYGNQGLTEQLELLFPPEHKAELMAELAIWLASNRITSVWVPSVEVDRELEPWFAERVVEMQPHVPFHHRSLPADWEVFVQGLNKSMRSNSRYYAKLLVRHGHSFELEVAETPGDVARALPEAIKLHRTRASSTEVSRVQHWDHFYRPDRAAFIQEIGPILAAKGEFKVGLLRLDGEVVAGQMWLEKGDTIFLYYSGFVPEWAKYGVQLVTTLEILKSGMRRGFKRVEFFRGGGHVKERWDTEVRVLRHTLCAPRPAVGRGLLQASQVRVRLRERLRWG